MAFTSQEVEALVELAGQWEHWDAVERVVLVSSDRRYLAIDAKRAGQRKIWRVQFSKPVAKKIVLLGEIPAYTALAWGMPVERIKWIFRNFKDMISELPRPEWAEVWRTAPNPDGPDIPPSS